MSRRSPRGHKASRQRVRLVAAAAVSLAAHTLAIAAIALGWARPVMAPEARPIALTLVSLRPPAPAPPAPAPPKAAAKAPPPRLAARRSPPAPDTTPIAAADYPSPSDGDLAGVALAGYGEGTGAGGGDCDMAGRLQSALRKDPLVRAAFADIGRDGAARRAIWVWNGDWVRSGAEDGKGLAAVREAMTWEIAFAPAPCRSRPMHGLVLLAVNDAPGSPRLAVGVGRWRWSDLLTPSR
jgi:hypothetical protein